MELVDQHGADLVVVGSSSSGLLGRIALGSVTERLVHTSKVPVALAPRGYPSSPVPLQRLTVAYGGAADAVGLIATSAELAKQWKVRLRIASFTVPPLTMFGGSIERSAEELVVQQWTSKTMDAAVKQLNEARAEVSIPDVDVVIGTGTDWREAVDNIAWEIGRRAAARLRGRRPDGAGVPRLGCLEDPAPRTRPGHDHAEVPHPAEGVTITAFGEPVIGKRGRGG